ncbi:GTPase HflX [Candidatus Odyssella acanthamoebae]|uniref:GTPase HflX n=1 Tax=Candidatus Odyssella acanthamoebae TaxID=91604 RepID=A0A077B1S4_9PROT|nr:GTPase HflX [Candidatus Paracaedibacter acanthamoebae]AIK96895.1 GTPase HflX [Candidatus Paracaedibacter acanthamoebae]
MQKKQTITCVLHVSQQKTADYDLKAALEEAIGLALAIDLKIAYSQIIQLKKATSATMIGQGNVEALADIIKDNDIELVVFDGALTPVQQRNLEKAWNCKVIDRTSLILEIFGDRARTAEGRLQVELAALTYQRSRLVRSWTHLERQRGGFGFTGGPGETQLELDRRIIDERIIRIKTDLEKTKRTRGLHRSARADVPYPVVALVGYTNAGKSTLFNKLTQADVLAKDMLFATLDPTMRQIKLPSGRTIILSDTVGFISQLPTQLVAAFRATLEEVCAADLILHVQDCAHPNATHQALEVNKVLTELGLEKELEDGTTINVLNKIDRLEVGDQKTLQTRTNKNDVLISAITGIGLDKLLNIIDRQLNRHNKLVELDLPLDAGEALAWLYRQGVIIARHDTDTAVQLKLQISPSIMAKFKARFEIMPQ